MQANLTVYPPEQYLIAEDDEANPIGSLGG